MDPLYGGYIRMVLIRTLNDNIKKIKLSTVIRDEEQLIINNIWSLILVKSNQYYVQGFDGSEISDILTFFSN